MLRAVNKGNHAVSIAVLTFVVFTATDAGRDNETGADALWVAPELLEAPGLPSSAQACAQPAAQRAELVFEMLDPADMDADLPRLLATGAREVVDFEWNETTGELSFSTTTASSVFSDLQYPTSRAFARRNLSCG